MVALVASFFLIVQLIDFSESHGFKTTGSFMLGEYGEKLEISLEILFK